MVINSQTPVILIYKGGLNDKIAPVVKTAHVKNNNNNNNRSFNEQKKNDVKTTAAILRIRK